MRTCSACINLKAKRIDGSFKVRCLVGGMSTDKVKYLSIDSIINLNSIRYFNQARICDSFKEDDQ